MNTIANTPLSVSTAAERLQQHNILPTQQRIEIARWILSRHQHFSAEQVIHQVKPQGVSKATVYNTLGLFVEYGLIRPVIIDPCKVFYDSNTADHYHFYDLNTGILTDIMPEQLIFAQLPQLPTGTTMAGIDVIIRIKR